MKNNRKVQHFEEIVLKQGEIIEITKDMIIADVVIAYPEVKKVLEEIGFNCIGCYYSMQESIEEGARLHSIDPDKLCKKINRIIIQNRGK